MTIEYKLTQAEIIMQQIEEAIATITSPELLHELFMSDALKKVGDIVQDYYPSYDDEDID